MVSGIPTLALTMESGERLAAWPGSTRSRCGGDWTLGFRVRADDSAPEAGQQQQQGGFEILDQRVHASRSPSPYLGKPAGNCQVLREKNSGSCNPLQAKDVWAGYENLTIRHPHLMPLSHRLGLEQPLANSHPP